MGKLRPCPIKGCKAKWYLLSGLGSHLFMRHNRAQLIDYILKKEAELLKLDEAEAHV